MRVNNRKKMGKVLNNITSNFKYKKIIFVSIDSKNSIDCNLFSRHVANICYENRKRVLILKESCGNFQHQESVKNGFMVVKHEYFDELEFEGGMEIYNLEDICTNYDLIMSYREDISSVFDKLELNNVSTSDSQVVFLFKRKNIKKEDLFQISDRIKDLNVSNFHILKV